jgi:rhodanese-related sulfurtransferase
MSDPHDLAAAPRRARRAFVLGLIVLGLAIPPALYWIAYGGVPTVLPEKAKELLRAEDSPAVLVDVRPVEEFRAGHIDGAVSWPLREVLAAEGPQDVPAALRDKRLLVLCSGGVSSTQAVRHLAAIGLPRATNVRGGIKEWVASYLGPEGGRFDRWTDASGSVTRLPCRESPLGEQLALVASGLGFKPAYTVLSLVLVVLLWRAKAPDLAALRYGMIAFFVGENCCAINYWFFGERSYVFEYLHGFGMLVSFGFVAYALLEAVDGRILHLSEPGRRCAAMGLCRGCVKFDGTPCGLRRMFYLLIPAAAVLALMPLCADWHAVSYNTRVFASIYNYSHPTVNQQFETLVCPAAAIALLAGSLVALIAWGDRSLVPAKILLAAGIGPLGFALFRTWVNGPYSQNLVWRNFWEETTELMLLIGICGTLWIFRRSLFGDSASEGRAPSRETTAAATIHERPTA